MGVLNRPDPEVLKQLHAEITALKELDTEGLRGRWRRLFRRPPPPHLPKYLLFRILAYRVQANALGDLDRESIRYLERIAKDNESRGVKPGHKRSKVSPRVPPVPNKRSLKPGTILVREHDGVLHRVIAMEKGFAWNGGDYVGSCSGHYRHELEWAALLWASSEIAAGHFSRWIRGKRRMKPEPKKQLRCAIYTRVSTEYGLEQEFNSLDAQRESSEAFVKSQAHEGWRALRTRYDDGGFSGASLERPALQQLLADIGLVDVVVVYKVDRLTRSLADFAKLVELFDAHGVSFVSVTQAFNTTNSMGRLTLNVLLSFAQFEREVTGERIRDKVAASRRKGIWMGGNVPLGYQVRDKKLVINGEEAERVRYIFQRYLELRSLNDLLRDLRQREILSKRVVRANGTVRGGICFTRGPLACLLKNRVYIGEAVHKGKHYAGEHEAVLEPELFEAVQQALASQTQVRLQYRINNQSLLTGKIFDDRGNRMTPATAKKGAARYRYYVSAALHQGRNNEAGSVKRVPASEIETVVLDALTKLHGGAAKSSDPLPEANDTTLIEKHLHRLVVRKEQLEITLTDLEGISKQLLIPWSRKPTRRAREVIAPSGYADAQARPVRAEMRARLLEAIATRRRWIEQLISGEVTSLEQIAKQHRCSTRAVRMTLHLAFLSPTIVKAAIDGSLSHGCGLTNLAGMPAEWDAQKQVIFGAISR